MTDGIIKFPSGKILGYYPDKLMIVRSQYYTS